MSRPEREESLDAIKKKPNVRCILISFKAGSTGTLFHRATLIAFLP